MRGADRVTAKRPASRSSRRGRRGGRGVTSYALLRIDIDGSRRVELVRADPGRGPVRQEPSSPHAYQCARRDQVAVQAGHHRHAAGEQPDGPVGPAVHHRSGTLPASRTGSPSTTADRSNGTATPLRLAAAASPDPAADAAPDQGAGGRRAATEGRTGDRASSWHPRHRRIYQTHLQRERQKVLGLIDDLDSNRFTILRSLTLLRRLSLDPALIDPAHERRAGGEDRPAGRATWPSWSARDTRPWCSASSPRSCGRIRTRLADGRDPLRLPRRSHATAGSGRREVPRPARRRCS